ncbi:unnamed protein product [Ilex paraguariensis]|uniref:phosphoribosyl-ATP diphosphatase n=1 Tax=Ilex paraguariensis TaxID=185542 RepID=A0ABC8V162_9AQUA
MLDEGSPTSDPQRKGEEEEADELCRTLEENEDKSRTASEMGDVLYHAMVLLALKSVKVEEVLQVLRQRFTQSGIAEKKSRKLQG